MTKLWIANCTKQHHTFVYRPKISDGGMKDGILRPMYGDLRKQDIPVGGQILVGDFKADTTEIRDILDQHKHIVEFNKLDRVQGFQGLCYREGDPVPMDKILERINQNDDVRTKESTIRQTNTAVEIAGRLRSVSNEGGAPFKDMRETDVQVAQAANKEVNGGTPQINRVTEVLEEGKEPSTRGRRSAG
jgi:hypothetical protein